MTIAPTPNMRPAVTIAADAAAEAGLGHLARCSAIAAALACRGTDVRCLALGASAPVRQDGMLWEAIDGGELAERVSSRVLLLDTYDPEIVAQRAQWEVDSLVLMHDLGPLPDDAALIVTSDAELVEARPRVIGGPRMACLRPAFWGLPDDPPAPARIARVLVTTGAGDPGGHAAPVARRTRDALPEAEVLMIRGPNAAWEAPAGVAVLERPSSMLDALLQADLAISAAGQTLYEAMAAGTATIALPVVENQRGGALWLERLGATEVVPPHALDALGTRLEALAERPTTVGARARCARRLVDGYGALRVAHQLTRLVLHPGGASDVEAVEPA